MFVHSFSAYEMAVSYHRMKNVKFSVFHIPLLHVGNALSVSVDECRRLFYFFIGDLSSLSAVVSVSWLSVNICCRRVVMSASCLSVSCHRFLQGLTCIRGTLLIFQKISKIAIF